MGQDVKESAKARAARLDRASSAPPQPTSGFGSVTPGESITLLEHLCAGAASLPGWFRLVPASDGKTVYLKWKWTAGKLQNRYVMTVGQPHELGELLGLLVEKVRAAEAGTGVSSLDKYYSP